MCWSDWYLEPQRSPVKEIQHFNTELHRQLLTNPGVLHNRGIPIIVRVGPDSGKPPGISEAARLKFDASGETTAICVSSPKQFDFCWLSEGRSESGLAPAGETTRALSTIAVGAEEEYRATSAAQANPLPKNHFARNSHAPQKIHRSSMCRPRVLVKACSF